MVQWVVLSPHSWVRFPSRVTRVLAVWSLHVLPEEGYYIKDEKVEKCSSKCKTCASGSDNSCTSCNWDRPYLTKASTDTVGSCELKCNHYRDEIDSDIIKCYTDDACPSNMNKFEEKKMCYSNF